MLKNAALLSLALALSAAPLLAQEPATQPPAAVVTTKKSLAIGDPAPALSIEKWVKGSEVKSFEKGKIYVVEFWATWCGPCMMSIPHLTETQKEYKDKGVTVIGVTSRDPNNSLEQVEKTVADKGDTMAYTVAFDQKRTTFKAWMEAANQNGIPTAFIVNKEGVVVYIGHPMMMDKTLAAVVDGTYDVTKAKKDADDQKKAEADAQAAQAALDEATHWVMNEDGYKNEIESSDELAVKAYAKASKLVDGALKNDSTMLNQIAWYIVDPDGSAKKKDLDLAMKAAQRGVEVGKGQPGEGNVIDTLARVYYCKGDLAKAIELQKQAVAKADEDTKDELQATLKQYEDEMRKKSA